jgi:hypothetical protein
MPYIKEEFRSKLDPCINDMVNCLMDASNLSSDSTDISDTLGNINYCFSRVVAQIIGKPNYNKIAMITGVLENIKQELYRRVASPYEDMKIQQNGDVKEYKNGRV